ncbi:MAG: endo-1,3-alpha-glucanase family glycosylhydrolase [bacterium]|nr:endo-1,3-alpha-glucanase family glycosylhydrolase [bacterium]
MSFKNTRFFLLVLLAVLSLNLGVRPAAADNRADFQPGPRQVYAFYFGWWLAESWGDPALTDRPLEHYDSRDVGALGRHIDQARSAGIDGFVTSWFGPAGDNLSHTTFNALLDQAGARGFQIAAAVDMYESGYLNSVESVTEAMRYLVSDRANHPAYMRYNGKPVIYFWNQGRFTVSQWRSIREQVDPGHNTIWVAEGTNTSFIGVFDGLYLFNIAWSGNPAGTNAQWAGRARSAGATFFSGTAMPGWDDTAIAERTNRQNSTAPRSREGLQYLINSFNGAANSGANVVLVVSWNEYFEGTHVEPSELHGTAALDTLRTLIAAYKGGTTANITAPGDVSAPANAPAAPGDAAAGVPSGQTFLTQYEVNLRDGASTSAGVVTRIPYNTTVEVVGRNAAGDWLRVNYNGQSGWVAAYLGQLNGDLNALPVQ